MDSYLIVLYTLVPADYIAIVNIIINSLIGVWIAVSVQSTLTTNRAVKDYFIAEVQDIKTSYSDFSNDLLKDRLSSREIIERFKVITLRLSTLEKFLKKELHVTPHLLAKHNKLKKFITQTNEFNAQFSQVTITLSSPSKTKVLSLFKIFSTSVTGIIIEINRATYKKSIAGRFRIYMYKISKWVKVNWLILAVFMAYWIFIYCCK